VEADWEGDEIVRAVHHSYNPPFDANEIIPGLWQGEQVGVEGFPESLPENFPVIVFAAVEHQPRFDGGEDPSQLLIYAPMRDTLQPTEQEQRTALLTAQRVLQEHALGKRVLVTCVSGLNRSGLIVGLVLIMSGWEPKEAIRHIRQTRSDWALSNETFVKILEGRR
jgi:protein-tyrosine phosphatase